MDDNVFHGSAQLLDVGSQLVPLSSLSYIDFKVLFATPEFWLAVICIPRATNKDFSFGYITNLDTGERHVEVVEKRPHAFDELLNCDGFVYHVSSEYFYQSYNTGMREEWISRLPATIRARERIHNVRQVLSQKSRVGVDVRFVRFDGDRESSL